MKEAHAIQPHNAKGPLEKLQDEKAQRLRELMSLRPGEKHYKRSLLAFLDADGVLQKAIETQLADRSWTDVR